MSDSISRSQAGQSYSEPSMAIPVANDELREAIDPTPLDAAAESYRAALDDLDRLALKDHYLAAVVCDHEHLMDKPHCACSLVDLGWHPSVGEAVDAWIRHALPFLRRARVLGVLYDQETIERMAKALHDAAYSIAYTSYGSLGVEDAADIHDEARRVLRAALGVDDE